MTGRRGLIAALLVTSAVVFALGVTLERGTGETAEEHGLAEGEAHEEAGVAEAGPERVAGLDVESPWLVAAGVVISSGLALAVWRSNRHAVLWAAGVFALGFGLLDGFELTHQLREGTAQLAFLSLALAIMHVAITVVVLTELQRTQGAAEVH